MKSPLAGYPSPTPIFSSAKGGTATVLFLRKAAVAAASTAVWACPARGRVGSPLSLVGVVPALLVRLFN